MATIQKVCAIYHKQIMHSLGQVLSSQVFKGAKTTLGPLLTEFNRFYSFMDKKIVLFSQNAKNLLRPVKEMLN